MVIILAPVKQASQDRLRLASPAFLGQPSRGLNQPGTQGQHRQREYDLACNGEPPLHRAICVEGRETDPRGGGDPDDDESGLHYEKGTAVVGRESLCLQNRYGNCAEAHSNSSNNSSNKHLLCRQRLFSVAILYWFGNSFTWAYEYDAV